MSEQAVVVTGASTGIGWGTAKVLLGKGFRVFGSVRREVDGDRLRAEFGERFTPLRMDVTDKSSIDRAAAETAQQLGSQTLAGLVNNAGIAVGGPLLYLPLDELRRQLEVNLIGQLAATQAFAPLLGADRSRTGKPGRIVNISSVGGRLGAPYLGPYAASKFALEGMSESLRRELLLFGIDVIVVGPGSVVTPIWDKAQAEDLSRYTDTPYGVSLKQFVEYAISEGKKGLTPECVGEVVYTALTTRKPKVRYAVVPQRFKNWTVPMHLPKRVLDRLIGKQLGLLPAR